jgi:hypothetical protein
MGRSSTAIDITTALHMAKKKTVTEASAVCYFNKIPRKNYISSAVIWDNGAVTLNLNNGDFIYCE